MDTSNGHFALALKGTEARYEDVPILHGLDLSLSSGEMVGIIGPNGSGKTTLLRVASGALRPSTGSVELFGVSLRRMKRSEIARVLAMLPQEVFVPFALTASEIVLMGRTPHRDADWARDREAVRSAMAATDSLYLADRVFNELSGGERQRVLVAMALAQEPRVLLLDEPTVHLDISHQIDILSLIRRLNRERGLTVLATMHDLNLAALYFDRLVMIDGGRIEADGAPSEVFSDGHLGRVFGRGFRVQAHPTEMAPQIVVIPRERPDLPTGE
jgi:iron complex transport system ATP-binding protein